MKKIVLFLIISLININVFLIAQIPTTGLVAHYPFSGNANDMSGNNYNGTVVGASLTADRFGNTNSAYSFNGYNNYINLNSYASNFNFAQPASISFWVKSAQDLPQSVYYLGSDVNNTSYIFIGNNITSTLTNELIISGHSDVIGSNIIGYTATNRNLLFDNNWHHIVCIYNDTVTKIYLDNNLLLLTCNSGSDNGHYGNISNPIKFVLGAYYYNSLSGYLYGSLDDVRIYNKTLNAAEVNSLFNEGVAYITATPSTICVGSSSDLNAYIGNASIIRWWNAPIGGTMLGTSALAANFSVSPTITTIYYAEGYSSTGSSARVSVTVTVNPAISAPTSVTAFPSTVACGNFTNLLANTSTGVIRWWDAATGGNLIGSSASGVFISILPSITANYYAETYLSSGCISSRDSVLVTLTGAPTLTSVTSSLSTINCGGSSDLNSVSSGNIIRWWDAASGGNLIGTSQSGVNYSVSPSATTVYYAEAYQNPCVSSRASVIVTVQPISSPTSVMAFPSSISCGSSSNLIASGLGIIRWWDSATGGIMLGTSASGAVFSVTPTNAISIYYAEAYQNPCISSRIPDTVLVSQISAPTSVTAFPSSVTCGTNSNLYATVSSGAIKWWDAAIGGNLVGSTMSGAFLNILPSTTTVYYAEAFQSSCVSIRIPDTVIVTGTPVISSVSAYPTTINCGGNSGLIGISTGNIIKWWTAPTGGTLLGSSQSGSIFTMYPSVTTTYYAEAYNVCTSSTRTTITITVNAVVSPSVMANPSTLCSGGSSILYGMSTGNIIKWWDSPTGGTLLGSTESGTGFNVSLSATSTYYAEAVQSSSCISLRASVTIIIIPAPVAPQSLSIDRTNFCYNDAGNIVLSVSGGSGSIIKWYSGNCNGNNIGLNNPLYISSPSLTTTYWANWTTTGCSNSSCISVTASVIQLPALSGSISGSIITCTSGSELYNVSNISGTTYTWTAPNGWTGTSTSNSITYTIGSSGIIRVIPTNTCGNGTPLSLYVSANSFSIDADSAIASPEIVCSGASSTLLVSGGALGTGANWYWYSNSCGGSIAIGTGTSINQTPVALTTYYVRAENTCNSTTCVSVTISINTIPPIAPSWANSDTNNFCGNTGGNITLTSSGGFGTSLYWYSNTCGGTYIGTGNLKVISKPTATTVYFTRWLNCTSSSCVSKTVTVIAAPEAPLTLSSSNNYICSNMGGTISLSGSGGSGDSFNWFSISCGNTNIGSGEIISVITPTVSTTYWGRWENISCGNSNCISMTVTVFSSPPSQPSVITGNANVFPGNSEIYSVTNILGTTYTWTAPTDWVGTSTSNSISYTINSSGIITVTPSNLCGSGLASSIYISLGYTISGNFNYDDTSGAHSFEPLDYVWVYLMKNGTKIDSVQADANGHYQLNNAHNDTFNVTATTHKPWGGVNVTDAIKVKRHFAGVELFTSSLRLHTADVNISLLANPTDAIRITRRFSGADTAFYENGTSIVREDWIFEKPFGGDTINISTYMNDTVVVNGNDVVQDFRGLCVGDVNGSYVVPLGAKASPKVMINYDKIKKLNSNEYFELPIKSTSDINVGAISLILNFPKNLVSISDVILVTDNGYEDVFYHAKGNELRIGWFETKGAVNMNNAYIIVKLKTTSNFKKGDVINFKVADNYLCELADENGEPFNNVILNTYSIEHINSLSIESTINAEDNKMFVFPNPANDILNINYNIIKDGVIAISIYNVLGTKVADIVNKYQNKGTYNSEIDLSSIPSGVYTIKMNSANGTTSVRRFIIAK